VHLGCLELSVRASGKWSQLHCMSCRSAYDGEAGVYLHELAVKTATEAGKSELHIAVLLFNLANAYGRVGDAKRKREVLERVLRIEERHYGAEHEYVAATLNNLANAHFSAGDPHEAKSLLERCLTIKQRSNVPRACIVLTQNNLANAYRLCGDLGKAQTLLEQVLRSELEQKGDGHYEVAMVRNNLASVLCRVGDAPGARALLEKALEVEERHYGKHHAEVGCTLVNLALAEALDGAHDLAKQHCQRGVKCLQPAPNEYLISGLVCAGVVLKACGAEADAKKLVVDGIRRSEQASLGTDPVKTELREAAMCFGLSSVVGQWAINCIDVLP